MDLPTFKSVNLQASQDHAMRHLTRLLDSDAATNTEYAAHIASRIPSETERVDAHFWSVFDESKIRKPDDFYTALPQPQAAEKYFGGRAILVEKNTVVPPQQTERHSPHYVWEFEA